MASSRTADAWETTELLPEPGPRCRWAYPPEMVVTLADLPGPLRISIQVSGGDALRGTVLRLLEVGIYFG